jgi:hypothetical protein
MIIKVMWRVMKSYIVSETDHSKKEFTYILLQNCKKSKLTNFETIFKKEISASAVTFSKVQKMACL